MFVSLVKNMTEGLLRALARCCALVVGDVHCNLGKLRFMWTFLRSLLLTVLLQSNNCK